MRGKGLLALVVWFSLVSKGKRFDLHFKVYCWIAILHHVLVEGERALHEKHASPDHRLIDAFSLLTSSPARELDRDIFKATPGGDRKREFSKRLTDWS